MEWISVEDRLPENDVNCLVMCNVAGRREAPPFEPMETIQIMSVASIWGAGGKWMSSDARVSPIVDVAHWMPLPEPPKAAGQGEQAV